MAETAVEYTYLYPFESNLDQTSSQLSLATSKSDDQFPHFFNGKIVNPHATANLLTQLARLVSTRYYIPPNMLNKILLDRDPVVTSGGGILRFEGFSACCSAYARVDLGPDSYQGSTSGVGTTNVDFNTKTRNALSRVRNSDRFQLAVGPDEVMIKHGFQEIIERKVKLPKRWIKGFVEIQAYQRTMKERFSIDKANAIAFLRSLPKSSNNKTDYYVVSQGKGLRISQKPSLDAVKLTGLKRLENLTSLIPFLDRLTIFSDQDGESSEWQIDCDDMRFSLTITANVSRGFSGEGQVLSNLAKGNLNQLAKIQAHLKWQNVINERDFAKDLELSEEEIKSGLAILGSQGLVGFDLSSGYYFHRELPFQLDEIDAIHPRLKGANKLIESNNVKIIDTDSSITVAEVKSANITHKVKIGSEEFCTCPWYAKYQGKRGDCKHVLAVRILKENKVPD